MNISLRQSVISAATLAVLLVAGCAQSAVNTPASSQPEATPQASAPPEVVPAKAAFWPMYTAAHQWASDVVVLRVTAKQLPGYKNQAGKAGMWEAVFASASQGKYRTYTYSIATVAPDIFKGVVAGLAMPWGGITRDSMPIDVSSFTVDSDAAYQAAAGDAADWLKKNPTRPLTAFEMGNTYKFQKPVWYVMWGDKKSGFATFVDASSGKVLRHG